MPYLLLLTAMTLGLSRYEMLRNVVRLYDTVRCSRVNTQQHKMAEEKRKECKFSVKNDAMVIAATLFYENIKIV